MRFNGELLTEALFNAHLKVEGGNDGWILGGASGPQGAATANQFQRTVIGTESRAVGYSSETPGRKQENISALAPKTALNLPSQRSLHKTIELLHRATRKSAADLLTPNNTTRLVNGSRSPD